MKCHKVVREYLFALQFVVFLLIGKTYALDIKAKPITFIMRHRKAPSKCEECHVKEGITTGLSGDLLCLECFELQRRNATQQTNVKVKVTDTKKTLVLQAVRTLRSLSRAK